MGGVTHFSGDDIKKYQVFVETGTFVGSGTEALASLCGRGYTIDVFDQCQRKLPNVEYLIGQSTDFLEEICLKEKEPIVFWLDAHYPKAYGSGENIEELPLLKELQIIAATRQNYLDLILMDDLRIYESGNFQSGNLPPGYMKGESDFVERAQALFPTRKIVREYQEEGYLSIWP